MRIKTASCITARREGGPDTCFFAGCIERFRDPQFRRNDRELSRICRIIFEDYMAHTGFPDSGEMIFSSARNDDNWVSP